MAPCTPQFGAVYWWSQQYPKRCETKSALTIESRPHPNDHERDATINFIHRALSVSRLLHQWNGRNQTCAVRHEGYLPLHFNLSAYPAYATSVKLGVSLRGTHNR
ncbi:Hypothetical predicted protein [Olea europaea subsp. europaea]|uniref:Uncharacterized protein n=1 Tax=Olea europaea subsp. europaea TaxID=158383 RepID=A0A8S0UH52_OLEEU|nr:Hypothetical predicted protein [Olea europaea subsp. europaea]